MLVSVLIAPSARKNHKNRKYALQLPVGEASRVAQASSDEMRNTATTRLVLGAQVLRQSEAKCWKGQCLSSDPLDRKGMRFSASNTRQRSTERATVLPLSVRRSLYGRPVLCAPNSSSNSGNHTQTHSVASTTRVHVAVASCGGSVGVDACEIGDFLGYRSAAETAVALQHTVLAEREARHILLSKTRWRQSLLLAAMLAAKEAVIKSTARGLTSEIYEVDTLPYVSSPGNSRDSNLAAVFVIRRARSRSRWRVMALQRALERPMRAATAVAIKITSPQATETSFRFLAGLHLRQCTESTPLRVEAMLTAPIEAHVVQQENATSGHDSTAAFEEQGRGITGPTKKRVDFICLQS